MALTLLPLIIPVTAQAESALSILEKVQQRQMERWGGANAYAINQSVMGIRAAPGYVRTEIQGPDGTSYPAFQPMT